MHFCYSGPIGHSAVIFLLTIAMMHLVFLHGGSLAAPLHHHHSNPTELHTLSVTEDMDGNDTNTDGSASGSMLAAPRDYESNDFQNNISLLRDTLVDIHTAFPSPSAPSASTGAPFEPGPYSTYFTGSSGMTSFQHFLESGGFVFQSVMGFFRDLVLTTGSSSRSAITGPSDEVPASLPPSPPTGYELRHQRTRSVRGLHKIDYV
jgi:hypothetical protein